MVNSPLLLVVTGAPAEVPSIVNVMLLPAIGESATASISLPEAVKVAPGVALFQKALDSWMYLSLLGLFELPHQQLLKQVMYLRHR